MRGLYALKGWFTALLEPVLRLAIASRLSPNFFTVLGVLGGVFAGFGVSTVHAWWVLVGVVIRLVGANLDGALARALSDQTGTPPTRRGFVINELGDRLADWAIFAGLFFMPSAPSLATWLSVMVAVALPTSVSLWGVRRAVQRTNSGAGRLNGGPFGKTERCAFAVVFVVLVEYAHITSPITDYVLQLLVWASAVTAMLRWQRIQESNRARS